MQSESTREISATRKPFLDVLNGQTSTQVPFWFMRQAGRYLPEYRELRKKKHGFLAMAFEPQTASEITLQPVRRYGMDAAIIFSDILVVPFALGQHLEFSQGEGPKLGALDFKKIGADKFEERLAPVFAALRETAAKLKTEKFSQTALIGFAGAPWTVATYMIEGGSSKDFAKTKAMAYGDPGNFSALMDLLVETTARYLIAQADAGAEALQIFDSWAGALDPHGLQYQVIEPTKKIVAKVKAAHPHIPIIGFPRGAAMHYGAYAEQTGIDAVALDSLVCTRWAKTNLQQRLPVQGNLDPIRLLAGGEGLRKAAHKILRDFSGGPHVFNLGHGVHKDTPPAHVGELVRIIRDFRRS
jgi:uroporphyrinogen decarboxylase